MLIFIYGDNSYLSLKKLDAMKSRFLEKVDPSGINFSEFSFNSSKEIKISDIAQSIQSSPFLAEKRMAVIKGLLEKFSKKDEAKVWVDLFEKIPESTIVILFEELSEKKTARHSLFKYFQEKVGVYKYAFNVLSEVETFNLAFKFSKEIGLQVSEKQLNKLIFMIGNDLWQLFNEMNKISAFANGAIVSDKNIELLVRAGSEEKIFDLMDALSNKESNLALGYLNDERNFGVAEGYLFAMLSRQVRLLLSVKDILNRNGNARRQEIVKELGVHPFVVQKVIQQAKNFDFQRLLDFQDIFYKFDFKIKHGELTERVAVDRGIIEIMGVA